MLNHCPRRLFVICCLMSLSIQPLSATEQDLKSWLSQPIIEKDLPWKEVQKYIAPRVLGMPEMNSVTDWEKYISKVRSDVLNKVVYRGEATKWRDSKMNVVWLETIEGGPEYKIQKLRFEALPGLWIPSACSICPISFQEKCPLY